MNDNLENDTLENETEVVAPEATDDVGLMSDLSKELKSALAQKEHFRDKLAKAEAERKALEARFNAGVSVDGKAPLAVEEYIDISTALDGLDQREKAFLAEQHRLSGKPLREIREGEDFQLWNSAYRSKMEKEAALKPNATQAVEPGPASLQERLRGATVVEKEAILRELNLYRESRPRADRTNIGNTRTR